MHKSVNIVKKKGQMKFLSDQSRSAYVSVVDRSGVVGVATKES